MSARPSVIVGRTFQYCAMAVLLIFLSFPTFWLISTSFKSVQDLSSLHFILFPMDPTFDNFKAAWHEQPILSSTINSVLISTSTAILTIIIAVPAAYALARAKGLFPKLAAGWVLLSQMFPFIIIIIPLFLLLIKMGLYNNLAGLIGVYVVWGIPFSVWMLRNYILAIPVELEEAGAADGASQRQILWRIVGPLLLPGLVASGLWVFINTWNEYFFALVLIKDPGSMPLSLMLIRMVGPDGAAAVGVLSAASLLTAIPSFVLFAFIQKRISQGLLGGAVKG